MKKIHVLNVFQISIEFLITANVYVKKDTMMMAQVVVTKNATTHVPPAQSTIIFKIILINFIALRTLIAYLVMKICIEN